MSAKNRIRPSVPNDAYPTNTNLIGTALHRVMEDHPEFSPQNFLEPGCGAAPFCDEVLRLKKKLFPRIKERVAVDITPQTVSRHHQFVQTDYLFWTPDRRFDLIATNPAYTFAKQFIRKSMELLAPGGLCLLLLRLNFLGSQDRKAMWQREVDLRRLYVLSERPSFTGDGKTDATEYAWYLFGERHQPTLSWI